MFKKREHLNLILVFLIALVGLSAFLGFLGYGTNLIGFPVGPGDFIPENWGPPYDVFDNDFVFLNVYPSDPSGGMIGLTIIAAQTDMIFMNSFYVSSDGENWESFKFIPGKKSSYFIRDMIATQVYVPVNGEDLTDVFGSVVVLACKRVDGDLKCGCTSIDDPNCDLDNIREAKWAVQTFGEGDTFCYGNEPVEDTVPHGSCTRHCIDNFIQPCDDIICESGWFDCDEIYSNGCENSTGCLCIDSDGDGYNSTSKCGYPTDCDDNNIDINPDADETCDGIDEDCDGIIDNGLDEETCITACEGIGGIWLGEGSPLNCCGNDPTEFPIISNGNTEYPACCNDATDCVTNEGNCYNTGIVINANTWVGLLEQMCWNNDWHVCDENFYCTAHYGNWNTMYDCYFDGMDFDFDLYTNPPAEICYDIMDNDCDGYVDLEDNDCSIPVSDWSDNITIEVPFDYDNIYLVDMVYDTKLYVLARDVDDGGFSKSNVVVYDNNLTEIGTIQYSPTTGATYFVPDRIAVYNGNYYVTGIDQNNKYYLMTYNSDNAQTNSYDLSGQVSDVKTVRKILVTGSNVYLLVGQGTFFPFVYDYYVITCGFSGSCNANYKLNLNNGIPAMWDMEEFGNDLLISGSVADNGTIVITNLITTTPFLDWQGTPTTYEYSFKHAVVTTDRVWIRSEVVDHTGDQLDTYPMTIVFDYSGNQIINLTHSQFSQYPIEPHSDSHVVYSLFGEMPPNLVSNFSLVDEQGQWLENLTFENDQYTMFQVDEDILFLGDGGAIGRLAKITRYVKQGVPCTEPMACATLNHQVGFYPCVNEYLDTYCDPDGKQCIYGWNNCDGSWVNGCEIQGSCNFTPNNLLNEFLDDNGLTMFDLSFVDYNETHVFELGVNGRTISTFSTVPQMTSLTRLQITNANYKGAIPDLSGLTELHFLDLNTNQINGSFSWIGNLHKLEFLILDNNNLTQIPNIYGLTNLKNITIANNNLQNSLLENIADLVNLSVLDLSYNQLVGSLPVQLFDLESINIIRIDGNSIFGEFPTSFSGLNELNEITFTGNCMDETYADNWCQLFSFQICIGIPQQDGECNA